MGIVKVEAIAIDAIENTHLDSKAEATLPPLLHGFDLAAGESLVLKMLVSRGFRFTLGRKSSVRLKVRATARFGAADKDTRRLR